MEGQEENVPKKRSPKKGRSRSRSAKKEALKKETPKDEVLKEQGGVPNDKDSKSESPKDKVPEKFWKPDYTVIILAAVLGALITVFLPYVLPPPSPPDRPFKALQPDTTGTEIPPLTPKLHEVYQQAITLWRDSAYPDALKKLDTLISLRPDYVDAYIIRGRIYLENLKQYQNAEVEFKNGLKRDPHNKYLLYDLGLTYYYLGNIKQAIDWNQKALNQDPDLIVAIYNHAIYNVDYGEKHKDDSYYFKAIELYENVIKRDMDFSVSSMFNLAALYARLAKQEKDKNIKDQYVKKAVGLLDTAIEKDTEKGPEQGLQRLKKATGEIPVQYGEDLEAIRHYADYKRMIAKWMDRFRF